MLERRALGGDPRAQYVIATCAWPTDIIERTIDGQKKKLRAIDWVKTVKSDAEFKKRLVYAYKWATLAYCDRRFNDLEDQAEALESKNRIFERLAPAQDLGQLERKQIQEEEDLLEEIHKEVNDEVILFSEVSPTEASQEFVEQMEGLGASGLVTLASMRACPNYPIFEQKHSRLAIWRLANTEYGTSFRLGSADEADDPLDYPTKFYERLDEAASDRDRYFADLFDRDYKLFDPYTALAIKTQESALGRMGEIPVQYLQLALGAFRYSTAFRRGYDMKAFTIDNVYGKATSKLVKKAQSNYCVIRDVAIYEDALRDVTKRADQGKARKNLPLYARDDDCSRVLARKDDKVSSYMSRRAKQENDRAKMVKKNEPTGDYPTGWLSPLQARALICRAAVVRNDPYSYLHLAQMFAEGYGYPRNPDKAIFAAQRARRLFDLGPPRHASNHRDLRQAALTRDYKLQAAELEAEVYQKAADETRVSLPDGVSFNQVVDAINTRIANANYDETGKLCPDEVWGYWDTVKERLPRDSKVKVKPADDIPPPEDVDDEEEETAQLIGRPASLPVFVSVDAPVTLNATEASDAFEPLSTGERQ